MKQIDDTASRRYAMRRATVLALLSAVILTALLATAPGAGAAPLPPDGAWAWAAPYTLPVTVPPTAPAMAAFQFLAAGPSGSVYVAGDRRPSEVGPFVASRVDATGAPIWSISELGPGDAGVVPHAVATDGAKNLIVVGGGNTRGGDVYVAKIKAADGSVLWERRWNNKAVNGDDVADAVALDKAGNIYVVGNTETSGGNTDALVVKYSPSGVFRWKYVLATSRFDFLFGCGTDGDGNLYATGEIDSAPDWSRMVTLKLSPTGKLLWKRTVSGLGVNYGGRFLRVRGSSVTAVGGLWLLGMRPVIARYTLSGKLTWATASGIEMDDVTDMAVDAKGRVVVVGARLQPWNDPDGSSVAYVQVFKPGWLSQARSAWFAAPVDAGRYLPARFNKVALDGAGRVYCAGTMAVSGLGADSTAVVVRYPSVDAALAPDPWDAEMMWRLSGSPNLTEAFFGLLRVSDDEIYVAGQYGAVSGTTGVLDRLELGAGT
jgi:hypothetical protein